MSLQRGKSSGAIEAAKTSNSAQLQHSSMSPRLPRKSRHPGAYSSTSKLDNPGSLQVKQCYALHNNLRAYF